MKEIKMTTIDFMKSKGMGTKKRLKEIERIEKKLLMKKYQPLAHILNHIRMNLYCFLLYYDSIPQAKYRNTHKNILIKGKPYKFIYLEGLIASTRLETNIFEQQKISNSKRSLVNKVKCTYIVRIY